MMTKESRPARTTALTTVHSTLAAGKPHGRRAAGVLARRMALTAGLIGVGLLSSTALAQSNASKVLDTWGDSLTQFKMPDTTWVNWVRPQFTQRGVNMDGSLRLPSLQGWALAANPFSEPATGMARLGDIHLDTGSYSPTDVDLALPCVGPAWVIGRSYNGTQMNLTDTGFARSQSYQGTNWFQMSQPELVFASGSTTDRDMLYLVYGADRFIEFKRTGASDNTFKSLNGAAGVIEYAAGSGGNPGTWTYTDQVGTQSVFWAEDYTNYPDTYGVTGQLWKITDANGKTAYVGDATTPSTAITSGYYTNGRILKAYDSADRRFTYTYQSSGTLAKLTQVKAETKTGGTWASPTGVAEVGKVQYEAYGTFVSGKGNADDLKLVTITTPLSTGSHVKRKYYRYYTGGTYNSTTNPGYIGQLKMAVDFEGVRRYDRVDNVADAVADLDAASDSALLSYSSIFLEYHDNVLDGTDSNRYIKKATFNGECGCSGGGGSGTYEFTYDRISGYSTNVANTSYDTGYAKRTVIKRPDGTYETQYFDEVSQPLSRVTTGQDPTGTITTWWATSVTRDSSGLVTEMGTPESTGSYTHSSGTLTEASSNGLINVIERQSSGDMAGLPIGRQYRQAGSSTKYYTSSLDLGSFSKTIVGSVAVVRPYADDQRVYPTAATARTSVGENTTAMAVTAHSGSLMVKDATTSLPAVSTSKNGSGSSNTRSSYSTIDGRTAFTKNEEGIIGFRAFDTVTGQMTYAVQDADTGHSDVTSVMSAPTGFGSSGTALHYKTSYTYDAQGRMVTSTSPDGRVSRMYYTQLGDDRLVTLSIPRDVSSTYYGPVSYTVSNLAGKVELQGVIGIASSSTVLSSWITNTATDPITAVTVGTLERLSTSIYDSAGVKLTESRMYHAIPASGTGTAGTNYDASFVGYDSMGRSWRTKSAAGDITRTVFDALGRPTERWMGTNDSSFSGGESSGTDNMTKVETFAYDGGATAGNSHLTSRTQDADGNWSTTTDQRTTSTIYDYRGRAIVVTSPESPHAVVAYDNLGRTTGSAQYTTTSGLTSSAVPTTSSNRIAYAETVHDEMGRVWKSTRHKITQSTGASADSIDTLTWFDPAGRTIKVRGLNQHAKTRFDRLGRVTHAFELANDNDTTYAHVYTGGQTDVAADTVVEQVRTAYDNTSSSTKGYTLFTVRTSRHWNDPSANLVSGAGRAGELETGTTTVDPTTTFGRPQIMATWYDALGRTSATGQYGTNGIAGNGSTGTTFTYPSSAPSSDASVLVTGYAYTTAGAIDEVTDPKGLKTKTEYDKAGRRITTIANYLNGSKSNPNRDNDLYTRYTYANGLQTGLWVDIEGDDVSPNNDDQVTTYVYGVTKSSSLMPSQVASNALLRMTIYPDSSATSANVESGSNVDAVVNKYNALGQRLGYRDQNGNVIDFTFDNLGRETIRTVTTVGSGVDATVRRIETAYLSRGLPNSVTQFGATSGGSALDQVQYSYDDWGNLTKFNQDVDSAISGGSGRAAFDIEYALAKNSGSGIRSSLRRTYLYMPNNHEMWYMYASGIDSDLSRVSSTVQSDLAVDVELAEYEYIGNAQLVTTTLSHGGGSFVSSFAKSGTTGTYLGWDRFNRVIENTWSRDFTSGGTPKSVTFFDIDLSYDYNSNITAIQDNIHRTAVGSAGNRAMDFEYSVDNLNRVVGAFRGELSGGVIASGKENGGERWKTTGGALTITQTGNWATYSSKNTGASANFVDQTRTHNTANEITGIGSGDPPVHDANGNLTSQGSYGGKYLYIYDAFNRLKEIRDSSNVLVQEFRYNGLGYRTGWHYDLDVSGTTDSSDPWFYFCHDEKWRIVATYRATDSTPTEQFYYHAAGLAGLSNASYIDSVAMRDRDNTSGFGGTPDGTLEERRFFAQNWRADVSAILTDSGGLVEWAKYSAYGTPTGILPGDMNCNGTVTNSGTYDDEDEALKLVGVPANYDVRADLDLNGAVETADITAIGGLVGQSLGLGNLSSTESRKGYAGYECTAGSVNECWHVRHRVLHSGLGRWVQRDPAGYLDGASLLRYLTNPLSSVDPTGLLARVASTGGIAGAGGFIPTGSDPLINYYDCVNYCFSERTGPIEPCLKMCHGRYLPPGVPTGLPPFVTPPGRPWHWWDANWTWTPRAQRVGDALYCVIKGVGGEAHLQCMSDTEVQAWGYGVPIAIGGGYICFMIATEGFVVWRCVDAAEDASSLWPGNDPAIGPPGTEWRGPPGSIPGQGPGNFYNPGTEESFHPDLSHPDPIGPHWDYRDADGNWWRIFPDGTMVPKK